MIYIQFYISAASSANVWRIVVSLLLVYMYDPTILGMIGRLYKVLDTMLRLNLMTALWRWKAMVRKMRHHELRMMDLMDRRDIGVKRLHFDKWLGCYKVISRKRKTLRR